MKIIIKTRNIELTNAIEEFINDKIGGLKKFIKSLSEEKPPDKGVRPLVEFFVELKKETMHHKKGPFFKVKAWVHLPGKTIMAESENEDLRSSIIDVKDEMQVEVKKYKLRRIDLGRRGGRKIKKRLRLNE